MVIDTGLPLLFEGDSCEFITAIVAAVVVGCAPVADGAMTVLVVVEGVDVGALTVVAVGVDPVCTVCVVCKGTVVATEAAG